MKKPVLVVMAAGMGSRYGGLKQLDPVGGHGQLIIDYSIYDAKRAGFETVVFVIKHAIEESFKAGIGDRLAKVMEVKYAYQELDDLPVGLTRPMPCRPGGAARGGGSLCRHQRRRLLRPGGFSGDLQLPVQPSGQPG